MFRRFIERLFPVETGLMSFGLALERQCQEIERRQREERDWHAEGWQDVFWVGCGPNPNCKHDVEYEFRRGEHFWTGRLADHHPAFNIAGGLMFRPLASSAVIEQ